MLDVSRLQHVVLACSVLLFALTHSEARGGVMSSSDPRGTRNADSDGRPITESD